MVLVAGGIIGLARMGKGLATNFDQNAARWPGQTGGAENYFINSIWRARLMAVVMRRW